MQANIRATSNEVHFLQFHTRKLVLQNGFLTMYASNGAVASNSRYEMETSGVGQGSSRCFVTTFASDATAIRDVASSEGRKYFVEGQKGMDWEAAQLSGLPDGLMHSASINSSNDDYKQQSGLKSPAKNPKEETNRKTCRSMYPSLPSCGPVLVWTLWRDALSSCETIVGHPCKTLWVWHFYSALLRILLYIRPCFDTLGRHNATEALKQDRSIDGELQARCIAGEFHGCDRSCHAWWNKGSVLLYPHWHILVIVRCSCTGKTMR